METDTPTQDTASFVDPSSVSVLGVVGKTSNVTSPALPPEKKAKKEKTTSKAKKPVTSSATDGKIAELDQKWSDRFNRLEALLMAKSFQPTFSSDVRMTPSHPPRHTWVRTLNPFSQPISSIASNQPVSDRSLHRSSSPERTGPESPAVKQLLAGKLLSEQPLHGSSEGTGPDV